MATLRRLNFRTADILNLRAQCQSCLGSVDIPMTAAATIMFPPECPFCMTRWKGQEAAMAALRALRRVGNTQDNIIVSFELESPFEDGAIHDEFDFR